MRTTLQIQSQHFLKAGGLALLMSASWQAVWLIQSVQPWSDLGPLVITTLVASIMGILFSWYCLEQPKWMLGILTSTLLLAYLVTLHQTQDVRLMVGLVITLLLMIVLVVD